MRTHDVAPIARRLGLLVVAAAIGAAALPMSGCNAVEGLGEDLQESSENVRNIGKDDTDDGEN